MVNPLDSETFCQSGLTEEGDGICVTSYGIAVDVSLLSTLRLRARNLSQEFME